MKREEVFARDEYRCVYCGEVFDAALLTLDHVQARVRGGDHSGGNVVTACGGCNTRKGSMRIADFLASDRASYENFRRLAVHLWDRHHRAIEQEVARQRKGRR